MIDLNGNTRKQDAIVGLIDQALVRRRERQEERDYLGASLIGEECLRKLQFHFFNVKVDPGKEFSGRKLRIFDRGHAAEDRMAIYLKSAGFNLRRIGPNGEQFEFSLLDGLIKGHSDGVVIEGPALMNYPFLWENKCLGDKYWKQLDKERLKKYSSVYYGQVQIMMAYFELTDNPCLFTALNADTEDIYTELVMFDAEAAQRVSDNAVMVVKACQTGELLPRLSNDPSFFKCKWCEWHNRCFSL